ncbi:pentatricopeptide repeat-containing protein, putative [Ricinus communis]|uniref:Pentatricopeptide repeat-containing protein, putative n=1 Tax=Ricinus communis TaxID=3988 RepID=B9RKA7_RICCO|nr:pentatricopeptide repeat-containing protein, putative [Ricinus communis]
MASMLSLQRTGNPMILSPHLSQGLNTHTPSLNPSKFKTFCSSYTASKSQKNSRTKVYRRKIHQNPPTEFKVQNFNQNNDPLRGHSTVVLHNVDLMSLCDEGKVEEALECMGQGASADCSVFGALLDCCGSLKLLDMGKRVHEFLRRSTFADDIEMNNKLIEMYGNCGSVRDARRVFDKMRERNMRSWHLLISGYAANGQGDDGLLLFEEMKESGLRPDENTFSVVFAACSSAGAIKEGLLFFEALRNEYGMSPRIDHYLGVIDILGKAGHLCEAKEFIERMPFEPTMEVWMALRSFAQIHGDIELEDHVQQLLVALDPSEANANKIALPPRKKQSVINMLEGKNSLGEYRCTEPYREEGYENGTDKIVKYIEEIRSSNQTICDYYDTV